MKKHKNNCVCILCSKNLLPQPDKFEETDTEEYKKRRKRVKKWYDKNKHLFEHKDKEEQIIVRSGKDDNCRK